MRVQPMNDTKNYPDQTGYYKIKPRGMSWQDFDTVRLEISVGQPYHEGEKLKSAIEWAVNRFDNLMVIVGDTIQRYTLKFENNLKELEAHRQSFVAGDLWLERNASTLKGLPVIRWDDYRLNDRFETVHDQVLTLYHGNKEWRAQVDNAIDDTWKRRQKTKAHIYTPERHDEYLSNSLALLIEETATLALMYQDYPGISAYPGTFGQMWSMFIETDIPNAPQGLKNAHCLRLAFNKNKQLKQPPMVKPKPETMRIA
ncbi:MAG: hypothetical protein JXR03_06455 [Cyclobacteriaceae bacterium]